MQRLPCPGGWLFRLLFCCGPLQSYSPAVLQQHTAANRAVARRPGRCCPSLRAQSQVRPAGSDGSPMVHPRLMLGSVRSACCCRLAHEAVLMLCICLLCVAGLVLEPLPVGAWAMLAVTTAVATKTLTFAQVIDWAWLGSAGRLAVVGTLA